MVQFKDTSPATQEQIVAFERTLGIQIPESYKQFLFHYNGGRPIPAVVDIPGLASSPTDIQELFGLNAVKPISDLKWNMSLYAERLPHGFLPIGCDSGGGVFCMLLNSGEIYFIDVNFDLKHILPVASDFQQFLELIREFSEHREAGGMGRDR